MGLSAWCGEEHKMDSFQKMRASLVMHRSTTKSGVHGLLAIQHLLLHSTHHWPYAPHISHADHAVSKSDDVLEHDGGGNLGQPVHSFGPREHD